MKKWETLSQEVKSRSIIFKHEVVKRKSPNNHISGSFDVIHCLNWVNIIPITPHGEVIFVRQYRHGVDEVTLEIPGGAVDPGEEFPTAAKRELVEETGYIASEMISLGKIHPNPAFMSNECEIFLAKDVQPTGEMSLDPLEEIELVSYPLEQIDDLILKRKITHSLVINAFYFLKMFQKNQRR